MKGYQLRASPESMEELGKFFESRRLYLKVHADNKRDYTMAFTATIVGATYKTYKRIELGETEISLFMFLKLCDHMKIPMKDTVKMLSRMKKDAWKK